MSRRESTARAEGFCFGADEGLEQPVRIVYYRSSKQPVQELKCELLDKEKETCMATNGNEKCVFYYAEPRAQDKIDCETVAGQVVINFNTREILSSPLLEKGHDPIALTKIEANILEKLFEEPGRVLTRIELSDHGAYVDRSIDVHVARIRKKLGEQKFNRQKTIISSVKEKGYRIQIPPQIARPN